MVRCCNNYSISRVEVKRQQSLRGVDEPSKSTHALSSVNLLFISAFCESAFCGVYVYGSTGDHGGHGDDPNDAATASDYCGDVPVCDVGDADGDVYGDCVPYTAHRYAGRRSGDPGLG